MNSDDLKRNRWDGGKLFAVSGLDGRTDYKTGIVARSRFDRVAIDVLIPDGCSLGFTNGIDVVNTVGSDWFEIGGTVRGVFLDAWHILVEGECRVEAVNPEIRVAAMAGRTLVGSATHFNPACLDADFEAAWLARRAWLEGQFTPAGLEGLASSAYAKALSQMKSQVCTGEGRLSCRWTTPDRWPHRDMWLWDSVFHAAGWRHIDPGVARDAIAAVLGCIAEDGFIPHRMSPSGASSVTQPPVLAMGVLLVHEKLGDLAWLRSVYPKLCDYIGWDRKHRDSDGNGLLEWCIDPDPMCRSGESGLDNSPRFDDSQALDAVDFNAFLAQEFECLARIAGCLGLADEAERWRAEHVRLCELIRARFWSAEHRFFFDYDMDRDCRSSVSAVTGFLPLMCGAATVEQARFLVEALHDPGRFGTRWPIPSIARSDPKYVRDMWRGPTWVNMNWLVARGLDRYGFGDEAAVLRQATCGMIESQCERFGTMFEYYDATGEVDAPALMRKGKCDPGVGPFHQVIHDYGWTGTLYVDMLHLGQGSSR